MSTEVSIMIFARAPVPGQCKTRLIPALGPDGAAALHMQLVQHTLGVAIESGIGPVSLWCAPDSGHPFFAECARRYSVSLYSQCEGDVGARMLHAFENANGPALLAGSDIPCINANDWRICAEALVAHDAVFLPAEDGGYGLIGMKQARAEIFCGMTWSHGQVMVETRARMRQAQMSWTEPREIWDVDEVKNLARLSREVRL